MTAQAAALVVAPGLVLVKLDAVHAHKWVRYEDSPVVLELRGRREPSTDPGEQRVWVGALQPRVPTAGRTPPRPVFEAVAVFAGSTRPPPPASPWELDDRAAPAGSPPSRSTASNGCSTGRRSRRVVEVGELLGERDRRASCASCRGSRCSEPAGPRAAHRRHRHRQLHAPARLLGPRLPGRSRVTSSSRSAWRSSSSSATDLRSARTSPAASPSRRSSGTASASAAEIVRPDGTVWMRLRDWEDWRFHWPGRYRDVFRQPRDVFLGEELPLDGCGRRQCGVAGASCRHGPPGLARRAGGDAARPGASGPSTWPWAVPRQRRSHRLWGRIAAKEAARRIWRDEGRGPTYPADLAIVADDSEPPDPDTGRRSGRPVAAGHRDRGGRGRRRRDRRARSPCPRRASPSSGSRSDRATRTNPRFTAAERSLLARWSGPTRIEWTARFRCAARPPSGRSAAQGVHARRGRPRRRVERRPSCSAATRRAPMPCASPRPDGASTPGPGPW